MADEDGGFDLSAAYIRRAQGDTKTFMEGLAARLEGALPGRVTVDRRRKGLFAGQTHVTSIAVTLDRCVLVLTLEGVRLKAKRAKVVHGVTIGSEDLTLPAWLDALHRDIGESVETAEAARAVLHDFLLS